MASASIVTRPFAGLDAALVNVTEQVPPVVAQEAGVICAPSGVIKLIAVPSGTGLPRRSEAITINVDVTPS